MLFYLSHKIFYFLCNIPREWMSSSSNTIGLTRTFVDLRQVVELWTSRVKSGSCVVPWEYLRRELQVTLPFTTHPAASRTTDVFPLFAGSIVTFFYLNYLMIWISYLYKFDLRGLALRCTWAAWSLMSSASCWDRRLHVVSNNLIFFVFGAMAKLWPSANTSVAWSLYSMNAWFMSTRDLHTLICSWCSLWRSFSSFSVCLLVVDIC